MLHRPATQKIFTLLFLTTHMALHAACAPTPESSSDAGAVDASVGEQLRVSYDGQLAQVSLQDLAQEIAGLSQATVADIANAAFPSADLTQLAADFLAGDGFQPGDSPNCTDLMPVAADQLAQAYVDVNTRALSWDEALTMPGCLYVNDLVEVQLVAP